MNQPRIGDRGIVVRLLSDNLGFFEHGIFDVYLIHEEDVFVKRDGRPPFKLERGEIFVPLRNKAFGLEIEVKEAVISQPE